MMKSAGMVLLVIGGMSGSAVAQVRVRTAPPLLQNPPLREVSPQNASLREISPTGPPPAGLTVGGTPLVARVSWAAGQGVTSYGLLRADGPTATPVLRTPAGFMGASFTDTVPDPRITYEYRLVANYANGTYGESRVSYVSPPLTNPSSLTARSLGRAAFELSWTAVPGAAQYRVDGSGIPNTGWQFPYTKTNVINIPPGPQSWQVVALFPGNFADYANPTRTSAVNRAMPLHGPWLTKNNGAGSPADAATHLAQLCPPNSSCIIGSMLGAYGVRFGSFEAGPELVHYDNVTELGRPRGTACREGVGQDDRYTVCLTEAGPNMSLIVKGSKGTRFATLHAAREGDYWGDKFGVTTQATFDAEGPKFTPHVCIACHGGRYDPATGLVQGATLLPIDPGLVDLGANRAQLEEPLRQINAQILMSAPSPAVAKYINGMYGGRAMAPGATAAANYVPPGWASEANFYLGIVKKNCAMCHLATPASLNFLSVGNFLQHKDLIYASTCQAHSMPHAEVPFQRFWTEDTGPLFAPGLLAARLGYPSCQ